MDKQTFARIWNESATINEFCQRAGLDRRDASNMAAGMRRRSGMKLKHMPRITRRGIVLPPAAEATQKPIGRCVRNIAGVYCVIEIYNGTRRVIISSHERPQDAEKAAIGIAVDDVTPEREAMV